MAHPERVNPWSEGKPPEAVRQVSDALSVGGSWKQKEGTIGIPLSPLLLTPEEVSSALSICRTKVYELIRTGQLESVQIGSSRRIPVDAVGEYVERLRRSSAFRLRPDIRADRPVE